MKLNRKGYLTVEVILASVVAVTIAIFLMEITIKLVNVTDDAYVDTELLTDKALIIKNIKKLLEDDIEKNGGIGNVTCTNTNTSCQINFCSNNSSSIEIDNNNQITYNGTNNYEKDLNKNLNNFKIESIGNLNTSDYILFKITADSKFSKENFEANIIVYNNKTC